METREFVIDSSVVAKWFLMEEGAEVALRIRDTFAMGRMLLAVPTLLFYEVMNALRYGGAFTGEDLALASRSLSKYDFEVWQPRGRLLEHSVELSFREEVTVYDACYVALALRKRTRVITEDEELLEKFPKNSISLTRSIEILGS